MKYILLVVLYTSIFYAANIENSKHRNFEFSITSEYLSKIKSIESSHYKRAAIYRLKSYLKFLKDSKDLDEYRKVYRVNAFFNKFMYKKDIENYGTEDYWSTVQEFLMKGNGDCEDYAIAKFVTLLKLGIPKEKLTLMYSEYYSLKYSKSKKIDNKGHMVLLYKTKNETLVLDSNNYNLMSKKARSDLDYIKEIKI